MPAESCTYIGSLVAAADKAYEVMSLAGQIDEARMYQGPYCEMWARMAFGLVSDQIRSTDLSVRVVEWRRTPDIVGFVATGVYFHRYLEVETPDETVLMDGTWQQFLTRDRRFRELPRILTGGRKELIETAAKAGVEKRRLQLWEDSNRRKVIKTS